MSSPSNNKKRKASSTHINLNAMEQLRKLSKIDVLHLLKNELGFEDEEVVSIALKGRHLYNAISDYRICLESNETPLTAKQALINSLQKDSNNCESVSTTLANWLIDEYIRNENTTLYNSEDVTVDEMVNFITKHIKISEKLKTKEEQIQQSSEILLRSFGYDFKFIGRETSVAAIMDIYKRQDLRIKDEGKIDKSNVRLPFIAAAPGVGKSRLLTEMGLLLSKSNHLNVNYFPLFVTFGNGCSYEAALEKFRPIESLLLRMTYSIVTCFTDLVFDNPQDAVTTAFRQMFFENDNMSFYIAIDEVHQVDTGTNENDNNPLLQIMSGIGQFMQYAPKYQTNILPLFAGTYHSLISHNLARSPYTPDYIPITTSLPEDQIGYILDNLKLTNNKLTNWRTNAEFRHFLRLFGGFPRGIEFYLFHLQNNVTERGAWKEAFSDLSKKYPVLNSVYSKLLLYYIITRKEISKTDIVGTVTFSYLENKGYIMLDQVGVDKFIATYPPVLLRNLVPSDYTRVFEELFFNFEKSGCSWETILHSYLYLTLVLLSENEEDLTLQELFPFAETQTSTALIKLQKIPKVNKTYAVNQIHDNQQKIKISSTSLFPIHEFDVRANNISEFEQKECHVVLNATSANAGDILILGLQEKHGSAIQVFHIQCKWADSESESTISLVDIKAELTKNKKLQFTTDTNETLEVRNFTVIITGKTVTDIPVEDDLIVIHKQNFSDYFGVFANHMKFLHAKQ